MRVFKKIFLIYNFLVINYSSASSIAELCPHLMYSQIEAGGISCICPANYLPNFNLENQQGFGNCIKEAIPSVINEIQHDSLILWLDSFLITPSFEYRAHHTPISTWVSRHDLNIQGQATVQEPVYNIEYTKPYFVPYLAFLPSSSINIANVPLDATNQAELSLIMVINKTDNLKAILLDVGLLTDNISLEIQNNGKITFNHSGFTTESANGVINLNQTYILSVEYQNHEATITLNSIELIRQQNPDLTLRATALRTNLTLGKFRGNIYEVVVYKKAIGPGKRKYIEDYLKEKWHIT